MAPDYDKSLWELDSREGNWALLISKRDANHACVIFYASGDWELNEKGKTEDMRRKYMRMVAKAKLERTDEEFFGRLFDEMVETVIEVTPEPLPNPYANHKNFGRF